MKKLLRCWADLARRVLFGSCLYAVISGCSGDAAGGGAPPIERGQPSDLPVENAQSAPPPGGGYGAHPAQALEILGSAGYYGFATRDFDFVDPTRSTPPNNSYPGSPARTLPTRVFYPALPRGRTDSPPPPVPVPVAPGGPFPIVAYAHGFTSRGGPSRFMCEHLATHGYFCVAPRFPLSHGDAPGGPTLADLGNQPGDLDFVMDKVAQLPGLGAAVDTHRRGLLGFSAGGLTVLLAAYHPALMIPDIQAAVAQAPVSCFLGAPVYSRPLPTLILTGTADMLVPPEGPMRAFELAPPPVVLAKLLGGTHSGFMNNEQPFMVNTDIRECALLLAADPQQGDAEVAAAITGGAGPGAFDPSACGEICSQVLPQTMGATRQIKVARAATLAHFEAVLRASAFAAAFLKVGLDTLPDVEVNLKL